MSEFLTGLAVLFVVGCIAAALVERRRKRNWEEFDRKFRERRAEVERQARSRL